MWSHPGAMRERKGISRTVLCSTRELELSPVTSHPFPTPAEVTGDDFFSNVDLCDLGLQSPI